MRGALFILILVGMAGYFFLQKDDVERLDLDEAENKIDQVEKEVTDALKQAQDKLDSALEGTE